MRSLRGRSRVGCRCVQGSAAVNITLTARANTQERSDHIRRSAGGGVIVNY